MSSESRCFTTVVSSATLLLDPINVFFDNTYLTGCATTYPEFLGYMLETEDADKKVDVKSVVSMKERCGKLSLEWTPMYHPEDESPFEGYIADTADLLGKSWTYKLQIHGVSGLGSMVEKACVLSPKPGRLLQKQAVTAYLLTSLFARVLSSCRYIQYEFMGELFTTDTCEELTSNPQFDHSAVSTALLSLPAPSRHPRAQQHVACHVPILKFCRCITYLWWMRLFWSF